MIPEICFQDYELAVQNEDAPLTNPAIVDTVRRGNISHLSKLGKATKAIVYEDPKELSWLLLKTIKIGEAGLRIDEIDFKRVAVRLLRLICLDITVDLGLMAVAWVRDTFDSEIDWAEEDIGDINWDGKLKSADRYPRLTALAKENPKNFRTFQRAINANPVSPMGIPDLSG